MENNIKHILKNAEVFFREHMQMDACFSKDSKYYPPIENKDFLKVQFVSIPQITKFLSIDNCESSRIDTRCIKYPDFALRDPGMKKFVENFYPYIILQEKEIEENDKIDSILVCRTFGIIGDNFLHYVKYFLHCENRNHEEFLKIPNKIIEEIEDFLKKKTDLFPVLSSF